MADLHFFSGFEAADGREWDTFNGTTSAFPNVHYDPAVGSGTYSGVFVPGGTYNYCNVDVSTTTGNLIVGFWFMYDAGTLNGASDSICSLGGRSPVQITKSGTNSYLKCYDVTGTTPLSDGVGYWVEAYMTDTSISLYLNGSHEITTNNYGIISRNTLSFSEFGTGTIYFAVNLRIDDVYLLHNCTSADDRLGEVFSWRAAADNASATADYGDTLDSGSWTNTANYSQSSWVEYTGNPRSGRDASNPFPASLPGTFLAGRVFIDAERGNGGGTTHSVLVGKADALSGGNESYEAHTVALDGTIQSFAFDVSAAYLPDSTNRYPTVGISLSGGQDMLAYILMATYLYQPPAPSGVTHNGSATANGVASVTAAGDGVFAGSATANGVAAVTAVGYQVGIQLATATANGIAAVTAVATHEVHISATATGVAAVTAAGTRTSVGTTDVRVTGYGWRKHFGDEGQHRYMQPFNTDIDAIAGVDYALRLLVENIGVFHSTIDRLKYQYSKNSGAWTDITSASTNIACNQQPVRYATGPAFVGLVNASQFTSYIMGFDEGPQGVLHKFVADTTNGICGFTNEYFLRYQRSTNNGVSWGNTKDIIGENWAEGDPDCKSSRYLGHGLSSNGSNIAVWYWGTYAPDPDEGSWGLFLFSTDNGVTWGGQVGMGPDASQPINSVLSTDLKAERLVVQEDGTLYIFVSKWISFLNPPSVDPDDRESYYSLVQYKSTNNGVSWTFSTIIDDHVTTFGVVKSWEMLGAHCDPASGDLYILHRDGDNLRVHKSVNDGVSWTVNFATPITITSSDPDYTWTGSGVTNCIGIDGRLNIVISGKYATDTTKRYVHVLASGPGGTGWSIGTVGPQPPAAAVFNASTNTSRMHARRTVGNGHSRSVVLVIGSTHSDTLMPLAELGPHWWESDNGGVWTGPHTTRVAREETYYPTLYAGNGKVYPTYTQPMVDTFGNVHLMIGINPAGTSAIRLFYDAEPPYINLDDTEVQNIPGTTGIAFDNTNHGFTWDGTAGPTRIRRKSSIEIDIKLRPLTADVATSDVFDFRVVGLDVPITMDVTPSMTIQTTEKVWPGTTGTTVTAGALVQARAKTTATPTCEYRISYAPSLPKTIDANLTMVPKGRKTGPFCNYSTNSYYVLGYNSTGPTVQFWKVVTNRDGTWAAVATAISVAAADSVWVEQGKYGYQHMLYLAIQSDSTGVVTFYELNTSTDTLSGPTTLHSPSPVPDIACVSIAVRNNFGVPQIVVGYQGERDVTFSAQRCRASSRDCSGGPWTHDIAIDGRLEASGYQWLAPTLVEGTPGYIHCFFATGPVNYLAENTDGIWAVTLKPDNSLSLITGLVGITDTASGLNTDYEPPGQAVAFMRDMDGYEVRQLFCWQNTYELDTILMYEDENLEIAIRLDANILQTSLTTAASGGTNDTANMVAIADDGDLPPNLNHRMLWVSGDGVVRSALDEDPWIYPGYAIGSLVSAPAVSRSQKLSAGYMYTGGGGVYVGIIYDEPTGLRYNEYELIPAVVASGTVHNATATANGVAFVRDALGLITYSGSATANGVASITASASVDLYDPNKLASATATGVAATTADGDAVRGASATANGIANVRARATKPQVGSATATGVAIVSAEPIISVIFPPSTGTVNVLIMRGEDGAEEYVENGLITSVIVGIEYGRNYLDEHNLPVKDLVVTVLYDDNYLSGQVIEVEDTLRGASHVGKIVAVAHSVNKTEAVPTTQLDIRVPLAS